MTKETDSKERHPDAFREKSALPAGCRLIRFAPLTDDRGHICVAENGNGTLPYEIQRVFWIYGVPSGKERGSHAHRTCSEILVPVSGCFKVELTDGRTAATVVLDSPSCGLLIPPMVWCRLLDFSPSAVCLCLASAGYDAAGYTHRFDDYIQETGSASDASHPL